MRLFNRRARTPAPLELTPEEIADIEAAKRAITDGDKNIQDAKSGRQEVVRVTSKSKKFFERNSFIEQIEMSFRPR